ncbi:hydrolase [Nonomuraea antimicrobica]|uniref:Hydrolase n=1 Tax=Nonomuraea antimicrobica TaxID=561173 RepID=A0ABP7C107_9ACTN
MPADPTEISIDNSAVVLIDHQPWVAFMLQIDHTLMLNNVTTLARAAKAVGVPTVLTTVAAKGTSPLADPIFTQISDVFPEITPIDRTTTAAWSDPNLRDAVAATGRRKLVMAGLSTEVCLAQTVLGALKDGYEVFFVSECSGGLTPEAHEDGKTRMIQAGARPVSVSVLISEWTPVVTSPERAKLMNVMLETGGSVSLAMQYVMAQTDAGIPRTSPE